MILIWWIYSFNFLVLVIKNQIYQTIYQANMWSKRVALFINRNSLNTAPAGFVIFKLILTILRFYKTSYLRIVLKRKVQNKRQLGFVLLPFSYLALKVVWQVFFISHKFIFTVDKSYHYIFVTSVSKYKTPELVAINFGETLLTFSWRFEQIIE